MTGEQIMDMLRARQRVGKIVVSDGGKFYTYEGVMANRISVDEADQEVVLLFNTMEELLSELNALSEDNMCMRATLLSINTQVVDAMQGTARSNIPADWWQAREQGGRDENEFD